MGRISLTNNKASTTTVVHYNNEKQKNASPLQVAKTLKQAQSTIQIKLFPEMISPEKVKSKSKNLEMIEFQSKQILSEFGDLVDSIEQM